MSWIVAVSMATIDLVVVFWLLQLLYRFQKTSEAWAPWRFMRVRLAALLTWAEWSVAIHGALHPWAFVVIFPLSIIVTAGLVGLMWLSQNSPHLD